MKNLEEKYAETHQVFTSGVVKKMNAFRFTWRQLVAPWWGYSPSGLTWEQVFVIVELLAHKARSFSSAHPDGRETPFDKLNATSAHGYREMLPLSEDWQNDLFDRFRHLILGFPCSKAQVEYTKLLGFRDLDAEYIIRQRTYRPSCSPISDAVARDLISSLHSVRGKTREKHNEVHRGAIHVHSSGISFGSTTRVFLRYGHYRGSSSWLLEVAARKPKELMLDFLVRASHEMEITVDGYESPVKRVPQ